MTEEQHDLHAYKIFFRSIDSVFNPLFSFSMMAPGVTAYWLWSYWSLVSLETMGFNESSISVLGDSFLQTLEKTILLLNVLIIILYFFILFVTLVYNIGVKGKSCGSLIVVYPTAIILTVLTSVLVLGEKDLPYKLLYLLARIIIKEPTSIVSEYIVLKIYITITVLSIILSIISFFAKKK